jgi:uncharacterized MAPEG superfamily protein
MQFAYWMILVSALLPYATIALVKYGGSERPDNEHPRTWLANLSGWQQRGDWAHRNHFEVFPIFAAGVFVAELARAPQTGIDLLAAGFVGLRILYTGLYLANLPSLRSAVWSLGFLAIVGLFVLGA